jgi:hypothetical protein
MLAADDPLLYIQSALAAVSSPTRKAYSGKLILDRDRATKEMAEAVLKALGANFVLAYSEPRAVFPSPAFASPLTEPSKDL